MSGGAAPALPGGALREIRRGAFVTLERDHELRGCIGRVSADRPVSEMVLAAALEDPRFPPVTAAEVPQVRIEISVLSPAQKLSPVDPRAIAIGRDGVIVERGGARGVLLPQVAPTYGWGAERLLAAACEKAGLPAGAWREPATAVRTFQADIFAE
jgi:AmmeMemoRadiSam system protein A